MLPGNKLSDASKEQAFNRSVADIDRWIGEVENALASDDIGKDVATVTSLIKKHQVLEVEVQIHKVEAKNIFVKEKFAVSFSVYVLLFADNVNKSLVVENDNF